MPTASRDCNRCTHFRHTNCDRNVIHLATSNTWIGGCQNCARSRAQCTYDPIPPTGDGRNLAHPHPRPTPGGTGSHARLGGVSGGGYSNSGSAYNQNISQQYGQTSGVQPQYGGPSLPAMGAHHRQHTGQNSIQNHGYGGTSQSMRCAAPGCTETPVAWIWSPQPPGREPVCAWHNPGQPNGS